jgi:hypothetical protein
MMRAFLALLLAGAVGTASLAQCIAVMPIADHMACCDTPHVECDATVQMAPCCKTTQSVAFVAAPALDAKVAGAAFVAEPLIAGAQNPLVAIFATGGAVVSASPPGRSRPPSVLRI